MKTMMILELISFVYFSPFVAYMWYLYALCPSRCLSQPTVQTNKSHCDVVSLLCPSQHLLLTWVISKRLTSSSSTERHHKFIFMTLILSCKKSLQTLLLHSSMETCFSCSSCLASNLPSLTLLLTTLLLFPLPLHFVMNTNPSMTINV